MSYRAPSRQSSCCARKDRRPLVVSKGHCGSGGWGGLLGGLHVQSDSVSSVARRQESMVASICSGKGKQQWSMSRFKHRAET